MVISFTFSIYDMVMNNGLFYQLERLFPIVCTLGERKVGSRVVEGLDSFKL